MNYSAPLLFFIVLLFTSTSSFGSGTHRLEEKLYQEIRERKAADHELNERIDEETAQRKDKDRRLKTKINIVKDDIDQLWSTIEMLQASVDTLNTALDAANARIDDQAATIETLNLAVADNSALVADQEQRIDELNSLIASLDLENFATRLTAIEANSVLALDGFLSLTDENPESQVTALFRGVNVQIVNQGLTTDNLDGTGNLIIGFNETSALARSYCSDISFDNAVDCEAAGFSWANNQRRGSHNIIVGRWNDYNSYGGFVGGQLNILGGETSSITGGLFNFTQAANSAILGGTGNTTAGIGSSISGGQANTTVGVLSNVSGGFNNSALGNISVVSGGVDRQAVADADWVAGELVQDQ